MCEQTFYTFKPNYLSLTEDSWETTERFQSDLTPSANSVPSCAINLITVILMCTIIDLTEYTRMD